MDSLLVRFIPTGYHRKAGWYGNKPALCYAVDEKTACCVMIEESEVVVVERPRNIVEKSAVIHDPRRGLQVPYSPLRFAERALRCGRPISEGALLFLKQATSGEVTSFPHSPPKKIPRGPVREGSDIIRDLAQSLGISPQKLRRFLRAHGLRAPYTDRGVLEKTISAHFKKGESSDKT